MSIVDPDCIIQHNISRQSTSELAYNLNYNVLGRNEKDVIVIDSSIKDLQLYQNRALPVETWNGSKDDTQLTDLMPFLNRLGVINDCREVISGVITDDKLDLDKVEIFIQPQRIYKFDREWKVPKQPKLMAGTQMKFRLGHWNI